MVLFEGDKNLDHISSECVEKVRELFDYLNKEKRQAILIVQTDDATHRVIFDYASSTFCLESIGLILASSMKKDEVILQTVREELDKQ